jgi:hypothetical protein
MGNVFWANPSDIRNSSSRFQDVSDTARRIDEDTTNGLGNLDPIGGDDEFGRQFDGRFYEAYNAASGVVRGTADGLDKTKTQLDTTAAFYEKADQINTQLPTHLV